MCVSKAHVDTSYLSEGDSLEVSNHLQGYSMRMAFLKPLIKPHLSLHLPQGRTPELQPPPNPLSLRHPFAPSAFLASLASYLSSPLLVYPWVLFGCRLSGLPKSCSSILSDKSLWLLQQKRAASSRRTCSRIK